MLRPHGDESGMPWYAIMLGYPVLGIWYWCADQTIVQRVLGAKDENHARVWSPFCRPHQDHSGLHLSSFPASSPSRSRPLAKLDLTALTASRRRRSIRRGFTPP